MSYQMTWKISDTITVTASGETVAEIHEKLSALVEVYGSEKSCGICSAPIVPVAREVDGNKFYELACTKVGCWAKFSLGQHKKPKGSLFPQRKDKDGKPKPQRGWTKFAKKKDNDESTF